MLSRASMMMTSLETLKTSFALDIKLFEESVSRDIGTEGTITRRLNAIKHFFNYLVIERQALGINPVKPSHFLRRGRPLPKKLSQEQIKQLFAQIKNPMDHALCLLM